MDHFLVPEDRPVEQCGNLGEEFQFAELANHGQVDQAIVGNGFGRLHHAAAAVAAQSQRHGEGRAPEEFLTIDRHAELQAAIGNETRQQRLEILLVAGMSPFFGEVETPAHFRIETQTTDIDHVTAIRLTVHAGIHPGDVLYPDMCSGFGHKLHRGGIIGGDAVETGPVVARPDRNQRHGHFGWRHFFLGIQAVDDLVHGAVAADHQQFPPTFPHGFPGQFNGMISMVRHGSQVIYLAGFKKVLDLGPVFARLAAAGTAADDDTPSGMISHDLDSSSGFSSAKLLFFS